MCGTIDGKGNRRPRPPRRAVQTAGDTAPQRGAAKENDDDRTDTHPPGTLRGSGQLADPVSGPADDRPRGGGADPGRGHGSLRRHVQLALGAGRRPGGAPAGDRRPCRHLRALHSRRDPAADAGAGRTGDIRLQLLRRGAGPGAHGQRPLRPLQPESDARVAPGPAPPGGGADLLAPG